MWSIRRNSRYVPPDEESVEHGTKLISQIDGGLSGVNGTVMDQNGHVIWTYQRREDLPSWSPKNPFKKRDLVIRASPKDDGIAIGRISFVPPVFNVTEAGTLVGAIEMRSIFRNQYSISFDGARSLAFRMPLFTVFFYGQSNAGIEVWVRVGPSERHWNILLRPGTLQWPLIAALVFIHTERYYYG